MLGETVVFLNKKILDLVRFVQRPEHKLNDMMASNDIQYLRLLTSKW